MIDTDDIGSNESGNSHIQEMIQARISRRGVLSGGAALAATSFFGGSLLASGSAQAKHPAPAFGLGFQEVPPSDADTIVVPAGYTWHVLAPWGTPLLPGAPEFAEDATNTAADQARQVGFNHDGMNYFPLPLFGAHRGLLVLNHEYTDANQIYSALQGSAITPDAAGKE